jgi:hypothetical protein
MEYIIKLVPRRSVGMQILFYILGTDEEQEFRFSKRTDEEAIQMFLEKTRNAGSASLFKKIAHALPVPDHISNCVVSYENP